MDKWEFERNQNEFLNDFNINSPLSGILSIYSNIKKFYRKNRKLLYRLILLTIVVVPIGYYTLKEPSGQYVITTGKGEIYNTDEIEIKDGCVFFTRIKNKQTIIICGDFIIEKQN